MTTEAAAAAVSALRRNIQAAMSYESKNEADLGFLRDAPESADAAHMQLLDGRISGPALIRDGLSACGKEVTLWRKAWRGAATGVI